MTRIPKKIFLIGFMASGKTAVAKALHEYLPNYKLVDADDYIERRFKTTVPKLFTTRGEAYFRTKENQALKILTASTRIMLIATGGGMPCTSNAMDIMNGNGITIYLKTDAITLTQRLVNEQHKRPLIQELSAQELKQFVVHKLSERTPYYEQANHTIDASLPITEIVQQIIDLNLA